MRRWLTWSKLPAEVITAIEATLKGQQLVLAGSEFTIVRSLPHGHVAAIAAMARQLRPAPLLGLRCRARDIAVALIVSRVVAAEVETVRWPGGPTPPRARPERGRRVTARSTPRGLAGRRQADREEARGQTTLPPEVNPGGWRYST